MARKNIVYDRDKPRNPVLDTLDAEIVRDAARFLEDGEKMQLTYAVQNTHAHRRHAHVQPYRQAVRHAQRACSPTT